MLQKQAGATKKQMDEGLKNGDFKKTDDQYIDLTKRLEDLESQIVSTAKNIDMRINTSGKYAKHKADSNDKHIQYRYLFQFCCSPFQVL